MCHVTYLLISPQENPRFELVYRGNLQYPVEFQILRTEKSLRTEPPSRTCPISLDSGLDMTNRSEIWQAPPQTDTIIVTTDLVASRLHEIWR